ncbi:Protein DML1 [Leucoagaricus sp. SymC.cos]|nr:Protein DML1 [Leucoagaricus sp. SymC.cos]
MREILYLQIGTYSNYIGTHFWNTQDAYYSNKESSRDIENPVDDSISFTERYSPDGNHTLYPRVLMFDWKENFGTLTQSNALKDIDEDRPLDEIQQNRITRSTYHTQLEGNLSVDSSYPSHEEIRYWSDFSHVYYLPRSIQRVGRLAGSEASAVDWQEGHNQFRLYDKDHDLMDTSVRLFLEESDSIQGVQLLNDVSDFGGFCNALLGRLGDEFAKVPALTFPIFPPGGDHVVDVDEARAARRVINEALYLRSLQEHTTLSIPISAPQCWPEMAWILPYFSSSIVAAHVESVTLPLRTSTPQDSIGTYAAQLFSGCGGSPFAEMGGVIPVDNSTNFGHCLANYTNPSSQENKDYIYSVRDVVRGFSSLERKNFESWQNSSFRHLLPTTFYHFGHPLTEPLHTILSSAGTPPLVTSFFVTTARSSLVNSLDGIHMLSRLSTSNGLAQRFKGYASFVDASLRRRAPGLLSVGIDLEDIRELVSDLWSIYDSYPADSQEPESGDVESDEE